MHSSKIASVNITINIVFVFVYRNTTVLIKALKAAKKYRVDVLHIHGHLYIGLSISALTPIFEITCSGRVSKKDCLYITCRYPYKGVHFWNP